MGLSQLANYSDSSATASSDPVESTECSSPISMLENDTDKAATNSMQAFINAVEAQSGKKSSQENADYLIETAQQAIDILCTE